MLRMAAPDTLFSRAWSDPMNSCDLSSAEDFSSILSTGYDAPHSKTKKSIWANSSSCSNVLPKTPSSYKSLLALKRGPGAPSVVSILEDSEETEVFARKVFVGGLPIDVCEEDIAKTFSQFGKVLVDWPRRQDHCGRDGSRHMTGYVFLVFEEEKSVQALAKECHQEHGKYYLFVSSPTMRDKPVQVRPWRLSDMDFMLDPNMEVDARRTVFIGGVPRPTRAYELATVLSNLFGVVSYVGIDIDPELKYPKGAARVTFASTKSFVAAIVGRFVTLSTTESQKRVEIKPYVMDDQMCDECEGTNCSSRYAQYFCGNVSCLQYYCESCWDICHLTGPFAERRKGHNPLIRQGEQTKMLPRPLHHNSHTFHHPQSSSLSPLSTSIFPSPSAHSHAGNTDRLSNRFAALKFIQ